MCVPGGVGAGCGGSGGVGGGHLWSIYGLQPSNKFQENGEAVQTAAS